MRPAGNRVVERRGFGQRMGGAIGGIVIGFLLFVAAFPVIFWNESRAVRTFESLQEGQGLVITVDSSTVDPANEGALIHVTGSVVVPGDLNDPVFSVTASDALRLRRTVEMYQWRESSRTETRTTVGGGEERVTTYSYERVWSRNLIDSSRFHNSVDHTNPGAMPFEELMANQPSAQLGAFSLNSRQVQAFSNFERLHVGAAELTASGIEGLMAHDGLFYRGENPASPQIGDARIRFEIVPARDASIVAAQVGDGFAPFVTSNRNQLEFIRPGVATANEIFEDAIATNRLLTWGLRFAAYLMLIIGLSLVLKPLAVASDILPFLGRIVRGGLGLVSFAVVTPLFLLAVAIAWVAARPVLGVSLLILVAVAGVGGTVLLRKRAARQV